MFDQMKEIWINLELYFEIYEFSNFLGIFLDYLKCPSDVSQSGASDRSRSMIRSVMQRGAS